MSAKLFSILVLLFLAVAFSMFLFIDSFNERFNEATGLVVNAESFPIYLETHPAANALPKKASVEVLIGENAYNINGNKVSTGNKDFDSDITIKLPQGFEEEIGRIGLCNAIGEAVKDDKINVELHASKTSLMLKYYKLLKYKNCLK